LGGQGSPAVQGLNSTAAVPELFGDYVLHNDRDPNNHYHAYVLKNNKPTTETQLLNKKNKDPNQNNRAGIPDFEEDRRTDYIRGERKNLNQPATVPPTSFISFDHLPLLAAC